eukprot:scaffold331821_cov44-Prasinocladus_malaysianus.AAC.1
MSLQHLFSSKRIGIDTATVSTPVLRISRNKCCLSLAACYPAPDISWMKGAPILRFYSVVKV